MKKMMVHFVISKRFGWRQRVMWFTGRAQNVNTNSNPLYSTKQNDAALFLTETAVEKAVADLGPNHEISQRMAWI